MSEEANKHTPTSLTACTNSSKIDTAGASESSGAADASGTAGNPDAPNASGSPDNPDNSKDSEKLGHSGRLTVVLAFMIILSVVCVLSFVGKYIAAPWPLSVTAQSVSYEVSNNANSAIVDNAGMQLLMLDGESQVKAVLEVSQFGSPQRYAKMALTDTSLFVLECTAKDSVEYLEVARVNQYDLEGKYVTTVFEQTYSLGDERTFGSSVLGISSQGQDVYVCLYESGRGALSLVKLDTSSAVAQWGEAKPCAPLPDGTVPVEANYLPEQGKLVVLDMHGCVYESTDRGATYSRVMNGEADLGSGFVVSVAGGQVSFPTALPSEGKVFSYQPVFAAKNILFWVCLAFLTVLLVAFAIRAVVKAVREKRDTGIKAALAAFLIVLAAVFIVGFYTLGLFEKEKDLLSKSVVSHAGAANQMCGEDFAQAIQEYRENGSLSDEGYLRLVALLEGTSAQIANAGQDVMFYLVTNNAAGESIVLAESTGYHPAEYAVTDEQQIVKSALEQVDSYQCVTLRDRYNYLASASVSVKDANGQVVGVLVATSCLWVTDTAVINDCILLLLTLVDVMVGLSFLLLEALAWKDCFVARWRARKQAEDGQSSQQQAQWDQVVAVARPLAYLTFGACACVSMLLPLVTKDVLASTQFAGNALVVSIPITATCIGLLLSAPLQIAMARNMTARAYLLLSSVLSVAFFGVSAVGVMVSNIWVLTAGVFAAFLFASVVSTYCYKLAVCAGSSQERTAVNRSLAASVLSATALSGLIGGRLADSCGNEYLFFMAVAYAAVLTALIWMFVPGGQDVPESKTGAVTKKKASAKDCLDFVLDPPVAAVMVCVVVPVAIIGGYKSYLFPLFASGNGMDKNAISSILVYCQAVAFYLTPMLSKAEAGMGSRKIIIACGFIFALAFSLFFLNQTMLWAVMVLMFSTVIIKVVEPAYGTFWQNRVADRGLSKDASFLVAKTFEKGADTLRAPVLGALMTAVGQTLACTFLGLAVAALSAVFALVTGIAAKGQRD